jgi:hypothetical protein
LSLRQQGPSFGQNEPRPSLAAVVAPVCVAKAFSHFDATVVAFGHRDIMVLKSLPIPFANLKDRCTVTSEIAVKVGEAAGAVAEELVRAASEPAGVAAAGGSHVQCREYIVSQATEFTRIARHRLIIRIAGAIAILIVLGYLAH